MSTSPELFELKVLVEADGWHDIATLMASVDRALDPHQSAASGQRRWSVVANRVPAERAGELLDLVDQLDHDEAATAAQHASARHADAATGARPPVGREAVVRRSA